MFVSFMLVIESKEIERTNLIKKVKYSSKEFNFSFRILKNLFTLVRCKKIV